MYLQTAKAKDGTEPDKDLRTLEVMKSNYGPAGEQITIRWKDGVFVPESGPSSIEQMAATQRLRRNFSICSGASRISAVT